MIAAPPVIRPALPTDRRHILHVNRVTWEESYAHIYQQDEIDGLFKNILQQHGSWVYQRDDRLGSLVAEVDGRIVGFISMASMLNGCDAEIATFYLLPEYHGQGIGKRLWQSAVDGLQAMGYQSVWVWVLEKAEARHFYQAQGCEQRKSGIYQVGNHRETALGFCLDLG